MSIQLLSKFFLSTKREAPSFADTKDYQLLIRANYISPASAGIFTWLPLGLRTLSKLENIIAEEIEKTNAHRLQFPALISADVFKKTGRFTEYGDGIFKIVDRHGRDHLLAPTHEEMFAVLVKNMLNSYKDLPLVLYQIQTKYRDEVRPRAGLMRGREFVMKDSYTFDISQENLHIAYQKQREAYIKIFDRLGVDIKIIKAVSGAMGGSESEEFVADLESGEDKYVLTPSGYMANIETIADENMVAEIKDGDPSPDGSGPLKLVNCVELGHIFALGQKYTKAFDLKIQDENGKLQTLWMGSYGIGVTRLLSYLAIKNMTENGLNWPAEIAPYDIYLVIAKKQLNDKIISFCKELSEKLNVSILVDDRNVSTGIKFADAELIGIPKTLVAGNNFEQGMLEFRENNIKYDIEKGSVVDFLSKKFNKK